MPVPIVQQIVTSVGRFEQLFEDDDAIAFTANMSNSYADRAKGKHEFKTNASEMLLCRNIASYWK